MAQETGQVFPDQGTDNSMQDQMGRWRGNRWWYNLGRYRMPQVVVVRQNTLCTENIAYPDGTRFQVIYSAQVNGQVREGTEVIGDYLSPVNICKAYTDARTAIASRHPEFNDFKIVEVTALA